MLSSNGLLKPTVSVEQEPPQYLCAGSISIFSSSEASHLLPAFTSHSLLAQPLLTEANEPAVAAQDRTQPAPPKRGGLGLRAGFLLAVLIPFGFL